MFGRGFKESAPHNEFIKNFRIPIVEEIVIDLQKIYHKFNKSCLLWSDCNTCVCKHRNNRKQLQWDKDFILYGSTCVLVFLKPNKHLRLTCTLHHRHL